ncbi:MAG: leucyl aminopeptidase, partial [Synechococcales cyanobacterium]
MDVQTSELSYLDWWGDALAIGLFVDDYEVVDELQSLNNQLNGMVKELINEGGFDGKEGSIIAT